MVRINRKEIPIWLLDGLLVPSLADRSGGNIWVTCKVRRVFVQAIPQYHFLLPFISLLLLLFLFHMWFSSFISPQNCLIDHIWLRYLENVKGLNLLSCLRLTKYPNKILEAKVFKTLSIRRQRTVIHEKPEITKASQMLSWLPWESFQAAVQAEGTRMGTSGFSDWGDGTESLIAQSG